jgi:succinate dehydrogenase / fumarate reductase cytochrome b subunit
MPQTFLTFTRYTMTMSNRPLSPHLQVYRLPLTAMLSITHRMTGVFLFLGLIGIAGFIAAAAAGPLLFTPMLDGLSSQVGKIAVWLWVFALYFHACHGIRHLLWDLGRDFQKSKWLMHNQLEMVIPLVLTAITYALTGTACVLGSPTP